MLALNPGCLELTSFDFRSRLTCALSEGGSSLLVCCVKPTTSRHAATSVDGLFAPGGTRAVQPRWRLPLHSLQGQLRCHVCGAPGARVWRRAASDTRHAGGTPTMASAWAPMMRTAVPSTPCLSTVRALLSAWHAVALCSSAVTRAGPGGRAKKA